MPDRLGVLGARGFVGKSVLAAAAANGHQPVVLPRIKLPAIHSVTSDSLPQLDDHVAALHTANPELLEALQSVDVVINAAGLALPISNDTDALWNTNTLLPAVLDHLCHASGVRRVVHVSSSSVQGDQSPLTEQATWNPLSEYARSKASAEQYLLCHALTETVIYRATSVMGPGRAIVDRLVSFYGHRLVPVFGDGSASLPLSALPNTGAAIVALALSETAQKIAMQPCEGVTQRALAEALCRPGARIVRIPVPRLFQWARNQANALPGPVVALLRRADLIVFGQAQEAGVLDAIGYVANTPTVDYLAGLRTSK